MSETGTGSLGLLDVFESVSGAEVFELRTSQDIEFCIDVQSPHCLISNRP